MRQQSALSIINGFLTLHAGVSRTFNCVHEGAGLEAS